MKNNQKDAVRGVEQDIRWVKSTMTKYANELLDKMDSCESTVGWYMETFTDAQEPISINKRANVVAQLKKLNEAVTSYIDNICDTLPEVKEVYDERQSIRFE